MPKFTPPKTSGGSFVTKDEKEELYAEKTELEVQGVDQGVNPFDSTKNQYKITFLDPTTGEERVLAFNTGVASRDNLLAALEDYLDNEQDQEAVFITLDKVKSKAGRPVWIVRVVGAEIEDDE